MKEHAVVAAVLVHAERVLLCHRSLERNWYPNVWDVPGGHIEGGERPDEALRRELSDDLGIDVGSVTGPPMFRLVDPNASFDLTVWVLRSWKGTVQNRQPDEHDRLGWFGADELAGLTFADDRYLELLGRILANG